LTLFFALEESDSVAALKYGLKKGAKFQKSLLLVLLMEYLLLGGRLTTVSQHGVEIGGSAKLLIDRLESEEEQTV
jgi:LacI family transcriptional regulator